MERLLRAGVFYRPGRAFVKLAPEQAEAVQRFNEALSRGGVTVETVPCLCGGTDFAKLAGVDRYGLRQDTVVCRACGLVQSNPRLTADAYAWFYGTDLYRTIYDGPDFVARAEPWYQERGHEILGRLRELVDLTGVETVLEFGAGGGWNLVPFRDAGLRARGYDLSPELVALGQRHGIDMTLGGLEDIKGSYDLIVASHVIEHLTDPIDGLRRLHAHLSAGGRLYLAVPNIEHLHIVQLQNAHTYYFTRRTLQWACRRAGLQAAHFRQEEGAHQSWLVTPTDEPPLPVGVLEGHYNEIVALARSYGRRHRLRFARAGLDTLAAGLRRTPLGKPAARAARALKATR